MKKINPEHIKALLDVINRAPYLVLLSMKVCQLDMGVARIEVDLERKHQNPFGGTHGGVYASIIDSAAYWSAYCELEEEVGFTTLDLKVDNLSTIKEGKMIVEGRSLKIGRRICLAEATIHDDHGRLLAYGTSKLMVMQGLQSIERAIETMGYDALPPKFI